MAHEDTQRDGANASALLEVSNAMVKLFKQQFGRGPTKSRTHFAGPDTLVCVLENTFTPSERNMVAMGEHQRLRDVRLFFQHASEGEFRQTVEAIIGRRVKSFGSATDTNTDTAFEIFVLEPADNGRGADAEPS